ncbi:MAG TPA: carboxypeptidase regulatory-like domain-containing protein [Acidimicrobiales bacterium]|jgi:hypothetical protein|nr:carboxypeptidase regulatory-like domain-containing protein [Acidimicrobiales bacterium]
MRVDVTPERITAMAGQPVVLTVQVYNTTDIISAHRIRVLGVDPRWVSLDRNELTLFPENTGTVTVTVTLPEGVPAGARRLGIEVREVTPPGRTVVAEAELTVPTRSTTTLGLEPSSVTGGRKAELVARLANHGNAALPVGLDGIDPENGIEFVFEPATVDLAPGDERTARVALRAKRPLVGSPKARPFTIRLVGADTPTEAMASFIQRPYVSRGMLALAGLMAAIAVFAAVITVTFGRVVDKSAADNNALLQAIQGAQASGGSGSIGGKVTLLSSGAGVAGVTVQAFNASDLGSPVTSTATDAKGNYRLPALAAGSYKVRYQGAGFVQIWYPTAVTGPDATAVTVTAGQPVNNINVALGGVPAEVSGQVVGGDPTGATVVLRVPGGPPPSLSMLANPATAVAAGASGTGASVTGAPVTTSAPSASSTTAATSNSVTPQSAGRAQIADLSRAPAPSTATATAPPTAGALVETTPVGAGGKFTLSNVLSPSTYEISVLKAGYSPSIQQITLQAGEHRDGLEIPLLTGDGVISGTVRSPTGPLGGATITASNATTATGTVSLTRDSVGSFTLRGLPTPATYTLTVGHDGYGTQTISVSLSRAQAATGISVTLTPGAGSISGVATLNGKAVGGVVVSATNGQVTVHAVTATAGTLGSYLLTGLPAPSTYTVTFSRADLTSVTRSVALDPQGTLNATGVNASLTANAASISGATVCQAAEPQPNPPCGTAGQGLGGVAIAAVSGSSTFRTTSADGTGAYLLAGLPPGTYTVTFSRSGAPATTQLFTLGAGQAARFTAQMQPQATITGTVKVQPTCPPAGTPGTGDTTTTTVACPGPQPQANVQVSLYRASQFPGTPVMTTLTNSLGQYWLAGMDLDDTYVVAFSFPPNTPPQITQQVTITSTDRNKSVSPTLTGS